MRIKMVGLIMAGIMIGAAVERLFASGGLRGVAELGLGFLFAAIWWNNDPKAL